MNVFETLNNITKIVFYFLVSAVHASVDFDAGVCPLTHFGLVTPYGDIELCQRWLG